MAKKVSKEEMDEMINDQKEKRHYDEMSDEDKIKFNQQMEDIKDRYDMKDLKQSDYIDSKREGDYINEEDLEIDEAL